MSYIISANCFGKEKFWDFINARQSAIDRAKQRLERFAVYQCEHCGAYHVGRIKNESYGNTLFATK